MANPVGVSDGECHGEEPAHRVADQIDLVSTDAVDEFGQPVGCVLAVVGSSVVDLKTQPAPGTVRDDYVSREFASEK